MTSVLFVCMGNICRSPSAEGAFLKLLAENELLETVEVDSAGTHSYHVGNNADPRSSQAAMERGIDLSAHRARQVHASDFEKYTYILAMDNENYSRLMADCPVEHQEKVRLFLEFAEETTLVEVPDPYYGGERGFELVLDLVEDASRGLLDHIQKQASPEQSQNNVY